MTGTMLMLRDAVVRNFEGNWVGIQGIRRVIVGME